MTRYPTALLVLALALSVPASASDRRILLQTPAISAAEKKERLPKPKRSRFVEPDFAALDAPSLRKNEQMKLERNLTVALFDDKIVHVELDKVERNAIGASIWSGRIEGDDQSAVTIVVKDQALVATISTLAERFMIEPTEDGRHEAFELDLAAFPKESEPVRTASAGRTIAADAIAVDGITVNDSAAFIDVLVAYTDDVRSSLGGTAGAQTAATNAIAAANTAYQNSGVTPRLRLAGTAEVSYAENGNLSGTLGHLAGAFDGNMDELHALRNQVGADAVSLLVINGGGFCGIAYLMTSPSANFASSAFSVVPNNCAVGNLSFPHELGHNFGLEHDRFVSPGGDPAYPYGFGYVDTNNQFRDIMAYATQCGSCSRIPYFSNPNLTYFNRPLGVSYESSPSTSADNVRALNNAASIIANWRQATSYTPATFTDNPLAAGSTRVKALHITELRTAINTYRASVGLGAYSWTTISAGSVIRASHITEMRTALTQAIPSAAFTDPALPVGMAIKTAHIQQLRNYLD